MISLYSGAYLLFVYLTGYANKTIMNKKYCTYHKKKLVPLRRLGAYQMEPSTRFESSSAGLIEDTRAVRPFVLLLIAFL